MLGRSNKILASFGDEVSLLQPYLRQVRFEAGDVLCDIGDQIRYVYFLESGVVSALTTFEDGTEIESALIGRGGAVGALSALGMPYALTRDVCHLPGGAMRISVERLREACGSSAVIHDTLDRYCAWVMICSVRNGACNACHSVDNRLSRWLLTCSDVLEQDEIALPQEVFAKMLGVQRSSVSPILQKLRNEGLIALERGRLKVLNRPGLLARSCECYSAMMTAGREWLSVKRHAPRLLGAAPRRMRS